MKYILIITVFLLTGTSITGQQKLEKSVAASGATKASNSGITLQGTIGQRFVGKASNNGVNVSIGFWESFLARMSTSVIEFDPTVQPDKAILGQNYPNPADQETRIDVRIPEQSQVQLNLFAMNGRQLGILHKGTLNKGKHVFLVDTSLLPEGQYRYLLVINNDIVASKAIAVFHAH